MSMDEDIRNAIERKLKQTIKGIEETLQQMVERRKLGVEDIRRALSGLKPSFSLLSQRWVLEILYVLLFMGPLGFNEIKRSLEISSRSLSDKLKSLESLGYIKRNIFTGPPVRTTYELTRKGIEVSLLALPLIYYMSSSSPVMEE
jgi:DNA-binding HxlR family transcriptional regulator